MSDTRGCVHCGRSVIDKPNAKVCTSCFLFGMAELLDDEDNPVLPDELDGLTIKQVAATFGDGWETVAPRFINAIIAKAMEDQMTRTLQLTRDDLHREAQDKPLSTVRLEDLKTRQYIAAQSYDMVVIVEDGEKVVLKDRFGMAEQ